MLYKLSIIESVFLMKRYLKPPCLDLERFHVKSASKGGLYFSNFVVVEVTVDNLWMLKALLRRFEMV